MDPVKLKQRLIEEQFNRTFETFNVVDYGDGGVFRDAVRAQLESKYALDLDEDLNICLRDKENPHMRAFDDNDKEITLDRQLAIMLRKHTRKW